MPFIDLQRGFALFEILLGLIFMAIVAGSVIQWQSRNSTVERARLEAESLASFQKLAEQYILNNRSEILQATQSGTNANKHCVFGATGYSAATGVLTGGTVTNDTSLHTCAFDAIALSLKGMWPFGTPATTDDRWVAIVKQVYSGATPTGNLEVLFVKASASGTLPPILPWDKDQSQAMKANEAAKVLGSAGGVIPVGTTATCQATRSTVQACGNGWKVDLSQFVSSSKMATVKGALP